MLIVFLLMKIVPKALFSSVQYDGWMAGWIDGLVGRYMDGWMDR